MNGVHTYRTAADEDPYDLAVRMAKYGHKNWLVWATKDGLRHAARLTAEVMELAIADHMTNDKGKPIITHVAADTGSFFGVNLALADIYLANLKAGQM